MINKINEYMTTENNKNFIKIGNLKYIQIIIEYSNIWNNSKFVLTIFKNLHQGPRKPKNSYISLMKKLSLNLFPFYTYWKPSQFCNMFILQIIPVYLSLYKCVIYIMLFQHYFPRIKNNFKLTFRY